LISSILKRVVPVLPQVTKPARYTGNEINIIRKDLSKVSLRMAICYPDVYEIGMSNLGIRILYHAVNQVEHFYCERVFAPWVDFEKKLKEYNIPLYSLETFTPLFCFDVIGFSIGYELLSTNILSILDLGKIPILSINRKQEDPLVIAGGPGVFNPEPLADFIDVFIFGDGERALIEFLNLLHELKGEKRDRKLKELNRFDFTYVPSMYKKIKVRDYIFTDIKKKVKRRIEPELDSLPYPDKPLLPLTRIVQDRITLEINRGCINGCRFCQAGYIYRPLRERTPQKLISILEKSLESTGYHKVSLASLSVSDYTELFKLVSEINTLYSPLYVSISLPSLRVNSTNLEILNLIKSVRKSGLTFALESADYEARERINKHVDEEQLKDIIRQLSSMGWKLIKFYFMIGLPGVSDEGCKIVDFINRISKVSPGLSFNINIAVFVPKPHTPFQDEEQLNAQSAMMIINTIRKSFKKSKVKIKFQDPEMSEIEGILSRGDRRIGELILSVFEKGERFSSWNEFFDFKRWNGAMMELNIDKRRYLKIDSSLNFFPWNFVDTGVKKEYLLKEKNRALRKEKTDGCVSSNCSGCGVCNNQIRNILADEKKIKISQTLKSEKGKIYKTCSTESIYRMVFMFKKTGLYRFISHLDLYILLMRIGKAAGVPFVYSEGFNPKPRLILHFPLPLGIESECELGEVMLGEPVKESEFLTMYNKKLGEGLKFLKAEVISGKGSIASTTFFHDYLIHSKTEKIISILRNQEIEQKENTDLLPISYFVVKENNLFLRLDGAKSIKKILNGERNYIDFTVVRKMLWFSKENKLFPFLR